MLELVGECWDCRDGTDKAGWPEVEIPGGWRGQDPPPLKSKLAISGGVRGVQIVGEIISFLSMNAYMLKVRIKLQDLV